MTLFHALIISMLQITPIDGSDRVYSITSTYHNFSETSTISTVARKYGEKGIVDRYIILKDGQMFYKKRNTVSVDTLPIINISQFDTTYGDSIVRVKKTFDQIGPRKVFLKDGNVYFTDDNKPKEWLLFGLDKAESYVGRQLFQSSKYGIQAGGKTQYQGIQDIEIMGYPMRAYVVEHTDKYDGLKIVEKTFYEEKHLIPVRTELRYANGAKIIREITGHSEFQNFSEHPIRL